MYRILLRRYVTLCGAVVVPRAEEIISSKQELSAINNNDINGRTRVLNIFKINEYGEISPQLSNIMQCTFFTGMFGAIYGGFIQSKEAYIRFFETNQATKFPDHFEAKRKLQDTVTKAFGIGALKWSWRISFFGGSYVFFVTILTTYRGSSYNVLDFTLAGMLSGALYKMNMGLRGMIAAGTVGALMGLFAGSVTVLILSLGGTSLDEIERWTYEMSSSRHRNMNEALKKRELASHPEAVLLKSHDHMVESSESSNSSN